MLTAPWSIRGREIGRLSAPLGLAAGIGIAAVGVRRRWREWAVDTLRSREVRLSPLTIAVGAAACALVLSRVTLSRFHALDVNAWDFSVYYDRPVERTLHGQPLYSDFLHASTLSDHSCFVMLGFVPLYALKASPIWLVLAPAFAIAAAGAVAFFFFRAILEDDLAAALLAGALVASSATARAVQYVFHPEVFYPLAIFLCVWAWARRRPAAFGLGILFALLLKEDAILPIAGVATAILLLDRRRWTWAAAAMAAAAAMFALDLLVVMPHFSPSGSRTPWFSWYWAEYGPTPIRAALGIASHPGHAARGFFGSGVWGLLEPLLYLPLAGFEWLVAALPALLPYSVAKFAKLSQFRLYYSMPLLPFLFAGAARGLQRATGRIRGQGRLPLRAGALLLVLTCALDGAGYKFDRARPERREIQPLLATLDGGMPALLQGALLPHAGYSTRFTVLDRSSKLDGAHALLLDPPADPYPFSREELVQLIGSLRADPRYGRTESLGGLLLFAPTTTREP